ncbi:MAG: response regulator [Anaerolineae bacterium]|nr:response regulator [Anaerolineae bacterium]
MKGTGPRALVVEDDRSWQQILSEILMDSGMTVDVADSLDAATVSLRAAPHRLVVVDLSLGGGDHHNQDGLQVLDAVRRHDPGCVTVMLTGFATVELAVNVLTEHGAFTCLRKETFRRSEFREVVRQALVRPPPVEGVGSSADHGVQEDRSPGEQQAGPEEQAPGRILVVEDDAGWRSILAELLTDAGHEVRLCSSYGEALGRLRREKYALAVVDLSLDRSIIPPLSPWNEDSSERGLEGYRLLASTRAGGTPTVVVSGVGTPAEIERAYQEHGIFAYLEKATFSRRTFLQSVDEALAAGRPDDELNALTGREREVLALLARGLTNKEIAQALVITTNTVKRHLKAIFAKLAVHTRSAAAAKAVSAGVSIEDTGPDSASAD